MARDSSRGFDGLVVYRQAEALADAVWKVAVQWDWFAKETVGKQLVRAADSVGANIAEGLGRETNADNRRFALIARGSLNETRHFLRRAHQRKLLSPQEAKHLRTFTDNLPPLLNAYIRSIPKDTRRRDDK